MKLGNYKKNRISLWWYPAYDHGMELISFNTSIFRLVQRKDDDDTIIFRCKLPLADRFVNNLGHYDLVVVKYVWDGPLDNPLSGRALYYIHHIMKTEQWHNKLSTLDYSGEEVKVYLHATCKVDRVCHDM